MELDFRKQRILQAIVQDYVATAEPVGSQVLVERYGLGVKSATIRSEMAEMSERGYLRQPHTSAGRVPSDLGYRFYVNRLMPLSVLPTDQVERMRQEVDSTSSELDAILRRTCRLLAEMTRLTAVATTPDADDTELRQVFLTPAGARQALLVLLFSTGRAEHRLLDLEIAVEEALRLANALTKRLGGATLGSLSALGAAPDETLLSPPTELSRLASLWSRLHAEIAAAARAVAGDTPVLVEGTHAALEHPEFRDVERLGLFLSLLQERAAVLEMLTHALTSGERTGGGVQVAIGGEIGRPDLLEYSVVSSPYFVGSRERGTIGVLGPTRMDYGRASAVVSLMARTVSELLTRLFIAP